MALIEARLAALHIILPEPLKLPEGLRLPFAWVNVRGDHASISGHGPQEPDGSPAGPYGAVGDKVTVEQAKESARKVALSMLGSLKRELGSLDRINGWGRVLGFVNCAPGFTATPAVMNGFSDLIVEVFGEEIGRHSRAAVGVCALPFDFPVEVEAEVMIARE